MRQNEPFVSILTPVYNGGEYLVECIESVINQEYQNIEYIIVNNCSTDSTYEIASRYANKDSRVRVVNNERFVGVIENHNIAFKMISPDSVYCKVVSADDWITPDYLNKMVTFGESHLTAGIIGCYQQSAEKIKWKKIPRDVEAVSGREICRRGLLEGGEVFGTPTSLLYRSDLVRKAENFYPHALDYADTSACYKHLQNCDFGFVHEVLSFERIHDQQISASVRNMGKGTIAYIQTLLEYGPIYLTPDELETRKTVVMDEYFGWLGLCLLQLRPKEFWKYHSDSLNKLGFSISISKIIIGAIVEIYDKAKHPKMAINKVWKVLKGRTFLY